MPVSAIFMYGAFLKVHGPSPKNKHVGTILRDKGSLYFLERSPPRAHFSVWWTFPSGSFIPFLWENILFGVKITFFKMCLIKRVCTARKKTKSGNYDQSKCRFFTICIQTFSQWLPWQRQYWGKNTFLKYTLKMYISGMIWNIWVQYKL